MRALTTQQLLQGEGWQQQSCFGDSACACEVPQPWLYIGWVRTLSKAACRPAAILLYTPEADAALVRAADELGVACREVPPLKALRESLRSFWESGIPPLFLSCHKLLEQPLSLSCCWWTS